MMRAAMVAMLASLASGCFAWSVPRAHEGDDAQLADTGASDAATEMDAGRDAGAVDAAAPFAPDAYAEDTGVDTGHLHTGFDSGTPHDAGHDAAHDTGAALSVDGGACCVLGHIAACDCDASTSACSASFTACGDGVTCYVGVGGTCTS